MEENYSRNGLLKFISYSFIGIFFFFIPITIGDKSTIPLDHIVTFFKTNLPFVSKIFAFLTIVAGAFFPFIKKEWNKNNTVLIFTLFKVLGFLMALVYLLGLGPAFLFEKDLLPFLFEKLVVPVGLIVPIGAIFLTFLIDFGLMEFFGTLLEKIMRPVWKTPGRSAIDAIASFVGSYSIALLITDKVYAEGKYTTKEAAIIATGFSTVSATFMIIVAKTTGLMEMWNFFFWTTLLTTFVVTALTVRIPPLSQMDDEGKEVSSEKFNFTKAINSAVLVAENTKQLPELLKKNLLDGFRMSMSILPTILSIGLLGLLLAKFTPVFDWLGYLFYPLVKLFALPDSLLVSKSSAMEIAEMFLPSLAIKGSQLISRYVIAVTSISAILFFSASIPTILSTRIPLKVSHLIIIWFERTVFSLIIASVLGYLFL